MFFAQNLSRRQQECPGFEHHEAWGSLLVIVSASLGQPPSNNHITGANYDGHGDLTYDLNNSYTWDLYGKMISVRSGSSQAVCGTSGTCVTYDALGRAVEKNGSGTYIEMLYSPIGMVGLMSGQNVSEGRLPLPGGATSSGLAKYINHPDWLGTVRLQTNSTPAVSFDAALTPYGETYDVQVNPGSHVQFTGDFQDLFTGLFDTPNREMDSTSGSRWPSPDPAHASWNAYEYPTNPNSQTDPSGLGPPVPCPGQCPHFNPWFGPPDPFDYIPLASWNALFGDDTIKVVQRIDPYIYWTGQMDCPNEPCLVMTQVTGGYIYSSLVPANDIGNDNLFSYLLKKPWVVSWIFPVEGPIPGVTGVGPAGGVAWNPQTKNLCVGFGLGASAGHNAAIGPLTTSSGDVDSILSGWSVSGGGNLPVPFPNAGLGWQAIANSSGVAQGPTAGVLGLSGSVTWSACAHF